MFYKGTWNDEPIPLNDSPEIIDFFKTAWASEDPTAVVSEVLSAKVLWGEDLNQISGLLDLVSKFLAQISEEGSLPAH